MGRCRYLKLVSGFQYFSVLLKSVRYSVSLSSSLPLSRRGPLRRSRMALSDSDSISPHVSGWTVNCCRRESGPAIACWGGLDDASTTSQVVDRVTTRLDNGSLGSWDSMWHSGNVSEHRVAAFTVTTCSMRCPGLLLQCFGHDPAIGC